MTSIHGRVLIGAALLALIGCGHTPRQLTPNVDKHTLANGLEVYLLEDHSAPIVTFQYWAKVGSGDEWEGRPGITGLSHFFEHMMFRGTKKYPDYFAEISKKGGKLNAFTWLDVTVYWEKVASKDLEFVLDIESDRLKHMTVDFLNLEPEREVVKSERLMRTENSPPGSLREALSAAMFTDHSYHWPTVGWMRDLNAITIEQAREYFERYYAPNNAYIVLVGDFDTEKTKAMVEQYYGGFEKRDVKRTPRRYDPPAKSERRTTVDKPTSTDLFMASYRTPAGGHRDFVVLEVIEQLLTGGKTARLQKALVHGKDPIARSVSGFTFPFVDPGVLMLEVNMLPGKAGRLGEARLDREIDKLIEQLVPADELARAVAQLRGSVVRSMSTTHSRAQMMGFAIRATGDATLPWKRLEQYGKVTPEDIRKAAATYLTRKNRVVGYAVDKKKLGPITKAWLAEQKSDVEDLDALIVDAVEHGARRLAADRDAASIAIEERAIELLKARAEKERDLLRGNAEALGKLDAYLNEGEKGPVKRGEKVAARKTQLTAARTELLTAEDTLRKRLETVTAAAEGNGAAALRLRWATALLETAPKVELVQMVRNDTQATAKSDDLGTRALFALTMRDLKGVEAPRLVSALAEAAETAEALTPILDYAHMSQRIDPGRM